MPLLIKLLTSQGSYMTNTIVHAMKTTLTNQSTIPMVEQFDAFVNQLKNHDWHFEYSDDHSVWRRGRANLEAIRAKAKSNAVFQTAYEIWYDYIYKTPAGEAKGHYMAKRDMQIAMLRNFFKE